MLHLRKNWSRFVLVLLVLLLQQSMLPAQDRGLHPYPRCVSVGFANSTPDWLARFDVVVCGIYADPELARAVKAIDPTTTVIQTVDWNAGGHAGSSIPQEFRLKMDNGDTYSWYTFNNPVSTQMAVNFSTACPTLNGQQGWEWFADYITTKIDLSLYDGMSTDGLYAGTHISYHMPPDIDLNQNGVKDIDEYGESWVIKSYDAGVGKLVRRVRELIGDNKLFIANSGGWFQGHPDPTALSGVTLEFWGYEVNWDWQRGKYQQMIDALMHPQMIINGANPKSRDPLLSGRAMKDFYTFVRFTLTKDMLGGVYHSYQDNIDPFFYWLRYYDEYELNIGYGRSGMLNAGNNIWIRFFDEGVSVCNVSGSNQLVTDAMLQAFAEYDGPYYRFIGGQDPAFNNGEAFNNVTLQGAVFEGQYTGDGIILVKNPETYAITDILMDNVDAGTSPSTKAVTYEGNWDEIFEKNDSYYVRVASWITTTSLSGYHVAQGGSDARAIYTPTIGVPGVYEVYEWHGYHTGNESEEVNITINHAGGAMPFQINQKQKQGQWNLLGSYHFNKGNTHSIVVNAASSVGDVIADAYKLVWAQDQVLDQTAPLPVGTIRGVSVGTTESQIKFEWDEPGEASDGDKAFYYRIRRNGSIVSNTTQLYFVDSGLDENTNYEYVVYAVDDAGNESTASNPVVLRTAADITPPQIESVEAVNVTRVDVTFSEPINVTQAEDSSNYTIRDNITVQHAYLETNNRTVRLVTTEHIIGVPYTLSARDIQDLAANPNPVNSGYSVQYTGNGGSINVRVSCDDMYQIYINGQSVGEGNNWGASQAYSAPSRAGKNVVAVKGVDLEGLAGLVVEVEYDGVFYPSDSNWKVSKVEEAGWSTPDFNDISWTRATQLGLHGVASPWADYNDVSGISTDRNVYWIWSADNQNDNEVYFRFTINIGDNEPPAPPTGLKQK